MIERITSNHRDYSNREYSDGVFRALFGSSSRGLARKNGTVFGIARPFPFIQFCSRDCSHFDCNVVGTCQYNFTAGCLRLN